MTRREFALSAAAVAIDPMPVVDFSRSPKAVLKPIAVSAVSLGDGFWTPRRKVNVDVSLPTLLQLFEEKGIIDNFRRTSGRKEAPRRGPLYTDSDPYKWLEAVAFVLESGPQPRLQTPAEALIGEIFAAQEQSGYLNTYYSKENLAQRHTNQRHGHELYCLGHLLQAGVAWQRATGQSQLLEIGRRMTGYVLREFGPGNKPIMEGHPEFEMALVELYRATGERKYLDFAGYLLGGDTRNQIPPRDQVYLFTGKPFNARTKLEGHAVRAMYACCGATDYYLETGDAEYWKTLNILWDDLSRRQMYITGGVGARGSGEAFGEPYELPNQQAYTESCAAIGALMWNWRMLAATGDSRYTDFFERALYNGANSGLSLNGSLYCYRNPLELTGNPDDRIRNPWYDTTCCPPNLQRTLGALPGYFYGVSQDGLFVHLYHEGVLKTSLADGSPIEVKQQTRYPWEGVVKLTITPAAPREFALSLRIPAWSKNSTVSVSGGAAERVPAGAYRAIRRQWKPGDTVTLALDVAPRLTEANPLLREDIGKYAVEAGPLVYCMEGLDQPSQRRVFDWWLDLKGGAKFSTQWRSDVLGGIVEIRHPALAPRAPLRDEPLYESAQLSRKRVMEPGEIRLIPYYTFANREPTSMQVWIPYAG